MIKKHGNSLAKILIVDDNLNNLSVLGQLLRELNYSSEFALCGKEALNWLSKESFDLILLDVVMPEMDGYEVCERIKSQEMLQHIPIIFITIKNDIDSTVKGFEKGAVDYINKPFNSDELSARISTQIELKQSRDQLNHYINVLEEKNTYIMESIQYAQYIQKHILPDIEILKPIFSDQFILYKPKQVLSGDFYWFKIVGNLILFSVVDCTGHGVPGALMSIAAYTALNQAVNDNKLYNPAEIIQYTHAYLLTLFNKTSEGYFEDGMDITLCCLDIINNVLKLAGAKQKAIVLHNNDWHVISGDNRSVGEFNFKKDKFTETEIEFNKGDSIYLLTDGFVDQFATNEGKKYGSKRFMEFIDTIKSETMKEQANSLQNEHDRWKGDSPQIDDITVWGIRY
jgi:CheY-like chemotaxis protein